jgi:CRISPR-associated protein Cas2
MNVKLKMTSDRIRSILVCYDIDDPKRLRSVARAIELSGVRIQKSVFECSLGADAFKALRRRMSHLVEAEEDQLLYQPLCAKCREMIVWQGRPPAPENNHYWVV